MASLSNINGIFDVHSTGAILFSNTHGTSGQILRSNGNAAPTWVAASTVIGGPYLPLTGGTLSGPLAGTSATFSGDLTVTGNVTIPEYIYHAGNTNTNIRFRADRQTYLAGGDEFIDFREATESYITIGNSNDTDTRMQGGAGYIFIQGSNGYIGINDGTPSYPLDINGNTYLGGNLQVTSFVIVQGNLLIDSDSSELKLGEDQDAQMYHNGSHLFIDNSTGSSYIRNTSTGDILLRNSTGGDIQFDNEFAGNILFNTSNIERMRITEAGTIQMTDENGGVPILQARNFATSATGAFNNGYAMEFRGATTTGAGNGMMLLHMNEADNARPTLNVSYSGGIFATFTNGKVGIGTTSPAGKLEIKTGSSYTGHTQPNIKLINFGYRDSELNVFAEGSYFTHYFENYSGGNGRYYDRSLEIVCKGSPDGTYGEGVIKFKANPITAGSNVAEIMRITGAGKVGIGTTSPVTKLHVSNTALINDAYGLALVENTSTGTGSAANSALNIKSKYGTSQFMQWENQGLRIGSRILNNGGVGNVYFTAGADSVKMVIQAGGDIQIPTNSASLQLRSSGSGSYTSIRRDSANQLIVANTAGNQVFGIGNGGELSINNGASYSAQYTYTSGWNSSMQTLIPGSSLSPNAVYLVTIKCNSFGAPPYYASTVFHIATSPGTNGTGGSVPFNPPTATHVSSNAVWIIRISTIVSGRNGLEGYLSGGPTNFNGATIYVKATKIMTM